MFVAICSASGSQNSSKLLSYRLQLSRALAGPKDGHFIPLIPYEIREEDRDDVFRSATNDDSGELDLDDAAATDLPSMWPGDDESQELMGQNHKNGSH